jgi:hypothetical protein
MFERLHGALNLTPAQEDGWKMLEQAYAIDPQEMAHQRNAAVTMPTLTAPQRVDLSINLMKADLESLERRGVAWRGVEGILWHVVAATTEYLRPGDFAAAAGAILIRSMAICVCCPAS